MVDLPQSSASAPPTELGPRAEARASTARLSFVDALRLVAAVQMIQGHTLDALLAHALRHGRWFEAWTFARGLTSTAFLFTAGVSFALAHAAGEVRAQSRAGRARRTRRALTLIGLGYLMRAPLGILFGDAPAAALRNLLAVDVLQCIGVSLLLLEGLFAVVQSRRKAAFLAGVLGALCFGLAPGSDGFSAGGPWLLLSNYFTAHDGSLFPLVPAAGYVFWGLAMAELALVPARGPRAPALGLGAFAALLLGLAALLFAFAPAWPARVSPAYAALKLGLVVALAALLALLLAGRTLPRLLTQLASETLFLYLSHVLVLYAGHAGLGALIGRTQSLGAALAWTLGLLISTSAGALSYGRALRALRARFQRGTPRPQSSLPLG
jgi:hypothetical protein